jgi:hypothetical protein
VILGGSWNNHGENCTASNRNRNEPDNANNNLGCRLLAAPLDGGGQPNGTDRLPVLPCSRRQTKARANGPALVASANAPSRIR